MMDPKLLAHLLRFGAIGVLNTVFGYLIYFGLLWLGILPEIALLIATVLGVVFNFFTTGRLVFENRENRLFTRFVVAYTSVFVVNAAALRGLIFIGIDPFLAQAILLPFVALATFGVMRVYVFRKPNP